ncbi:MAG: hypothetical protein ACJ71T_06625 [Actinomycetales bacterium]
MPESPALRPGPARRTVLRLGVGGVAGGVVLATAGCDLRFGSPAAEPSRAARPDLSTDERALAAAAQRGDALATAYASAVLVRPDLADALRQLSADHTAHLRALRPLAGTPAPSPSVSLTPAPSAPLTALTALSVLAQAERAASTATLTDVASVSAKAARLLASVAACDSAHVAVLAALPARPKTAS